MLLSHVGQDVGVERGRLQEATPEGGQLRAKVAHVPADLLGYLLAALLQLAGTTEGRAALVSCVLLNSVRCVSWGSKAASPSFLCFGK